MELVGDILRGHTDTIILSTLEKKDSYGYEINSTIASATNQEFTLTEATLYTAFKRLEKSEYITSYWQDGFNNIKRKYYSITPLGKQYLKAKRENWINVERILKQLIGIKQ
ncbi:MAG: PadR family transcriptional regulator [Haloplasmataceae bacterium]|jgi:DNA-binding PadR family transcriptional regulator|nr:PadR family transcriptional regulator [Haloplasmataceae bacterium]